MTTAPINRPTVDSQPDPGGILITSSVDGFDTKQVVTDERLGVIGWIRKSDASDYCDADHCGPYCRQDVPNVEFTAESRRVMEDWHNDRHHGVFRTCAEQPCSALVKTMEVF